MTKTVISFFLLFVFLVLAQVVIFNRIWLFDVALPLVFIFFIVILPIDLNVKWVLTLSFALGFFVDIFSDTLGVNAMCCTIAGALRLPILKLYVPRDEERAGILPTPKAIGQVTFMKYLITMTTLYCFLFFSVLSFEFFYPGRLIVRTCCSSILTFLLLLAFSNFMVPKQSNRK